MRILFITSTRLGDAVLSTSVLTYISQTFPNATVTVACGELGVELFAAHPQVVCVHALKKQTYNRHWVGLWRRVVKTHWDMVIDLRNSAVSRLIKAKKTYVMDGQIDKSQHKVKQIAQCLRLTDVPSPKIWLTDAVITQAKHYIPDGPPVLALGPSSNWLAKTWPIDRFMALDKALRGQNGIFEGYRLALFAAEHERAQVQPLLTATPDAIDLVGVGSPLLAAACLKQCAFFIGNDSGLMHMAAAVGVKTLGLFGPTRDDWYRPWGDHAAFIRTPESYAELLRRGGNDPDNTPCLMEGLTVEAVIQKVLAQK